MSTCQTHPSRVSTTLSFAWRRTVVKHRVSISMITHRTFTAIQSVSRCTVKAHVLFPFVTRGMLSYVLPRHTCCRVVIFVSLWHVLLLLLDSSKVVFCLKHSSMHSNQASPFSIIYSFFNAFSNSLRILISNMLNLSLKKTFTSILQCIFKNKYFSLYCVIL